MLLNMYIRKRDTTLGEVIDPDYQGIFGVLLHSSVGKSKYEIQSVLWGVLAFLC